MTRQVDLQLTPEDSQSFHGDQFIRSSADLNDPYDSPTVEYGDQMSKHICILESDPDESPVVPMCPDFVGGGGMAGITVIFAN